MLFCVKEKTNFYVRKELNLFRSLDFTTTPFYTSANSNFYFYVAIYKIKMIILNM